MKQATEKHPYIINCFIGRCYLLLASDFLLHRLRQGGHCSHSLHHRIHKLQELELIGMGGEGLAE